MNAKHISLTIFALALSVVLPAAAQVSTPESREAILSEAERFTAMPAASLTQARFANSHDVFYTPVAQADGTGRALAGGAAGGTMTADRVILGELAEKVRPSGVMQFGEDTLLLFGQRRVKVGDFLSMQHNGNNYQIEVVKVEARAFMLRLNKETISKRIQ